MARPAMLTRESGRRLRLGQGPLLAQFFQFTASYGIALIALAADRGGGRSFARTYETRGTRNLIRTSLRPLTSSWKSGTAGAQPSGLGAHLVTLPQNIWPGGQSISTTELPWLPE